MREFLIVEGQMTPLKGNFTEGVGRKGVLLGREEGREAESDGGGDRDRDVSRSIFKGRTESGTVVGVRVCLCKAALPCN